MYCDPSGESLTELQIFSSLKTWINNVFPTFVMQVKLAILGFEDTSYQNAAELIKGSYSAWEERNEIYEGFWKYSPEVIYMKKIVVSITLLCLFFCGCAEASDDVSSITSTIQNESIELSCSEISEATDDGEVYEEIILVKCPYLESEDKDCTALNQIVFKKTEEYLDALKSDYIDVSDLSLDYEIMRSSDFVSIVYYGSVAPKDAVYPTDFSFSVNVAYSGDVMGLSDFVGLDADFAISFRESCANALTDEVQEYISRFSDDELLEMFAKCDTGYGASFSFVSDGKINVIFPVPNSIGDYVIVPLG